MPTLKYSARPASGGAIKTNLMSFVEGGSSLLASSAASLDATMLPIDSPMTHYFAVDLTNSDVCLLDAVQEGVVSGEGILRVVDQPEGRHRRES